LSDATIALSTRIDQQTVQTPAGSMNISQTRRHRGHSSPVSAMRKLISSHPVILAMQRTAPSTAQTDSGAVCGV